MGDLTNAAADTADVDRGLRAIAELRRFVERQELLQVEAALAQGWTWQHIGEALGVSRQAVHRKYRNRVNTQLAQKGKK